MSSLELNPDEFPWKIEAKVVGYGKLDPNEHVVLKHEHVRDGDYSGRKLKQFCAIGSRFERCRLENMRVEDFSFGAGREVSDYVECSFDGTRVRHMGGGLARFVRCSFKEVDIRSWRSYSAEFIDCVFTGRLEECIFYGTVREEDRPWVGREKNEFRGNDFSGCDLVEVEFRAGVDLLQQKLPSGPEYLYLPNAPVAIERALVAVQEWYDPKLRGQGLSLLKTLELGTDSQKQLLLRADDFYRYDADPSEVIDGVFAALRD